MTICPAGTKDRALQRRSSARNNSVLMMRMKEIMQTHGHYGYRRVHVMLKREGFKDNHIDLAPESCSS